MVGELCGLALAPTQAPRSSYMAGDIVAMLALLMSAATSGVDSVSFGEPVETRPAYDLGLCLDNSASSRSLRAVKIYGPIKYHAPHTSRCLESAPEHKQRRSLLLHCLRCLPGGAKQ